jgi:hypothetical protein
MAFSTTRRWVAAFAVLGLVAGAAWAQDEPKDRTIEPGKWYPGLELGVQLTQSSFTDNWNGGDLGTWTWIALMEASLERMLGTKWYWGNFLRTAYGLTGNQLEDEEGRYWTKPKKTTDRLVIESILAYQADWKVNPFLAVRFGTQYQDLNDPLRPINLNPLVFKETLGLARRFVDKEAESAMTTPSRKLFAARLAIGFRQMMRKQFLAPFPDQTSTNTNTNDGGLDLTIDWITPLSSRLRYEGSLIVYQPVFYSEKSNLNNITAEDQATFSLPSDLGSYGLVTDVGWQNVFISEVTKFISINLFLQWVYDKYDNSVAPVFNDDGSLANGPVVNQAIRKAGQFKQTLALSLQYRLF